MLEHVELDGLGQRSALTYRDEVAFGHIQKGRGAVDRHIAMTLLESNSND
jgi:hypothetical protein